MPEESVLILSSDGILERFNENGEQFGEKKLLQAVKTFWSKAAEEMCRGIFDTVFSFGNKVAWEDDATCVVIKRLRDSTPGSSNVSKWSDKKTIKLQLFVLLRALMR